MKLTTVQLSFVILLAAARVSRAQTLIPPAEVGGLVLFPSRDFVTIEGFQDLVGLPFKTEVVRAGVTVGAAWSTGARGDVAAEVNHPGGECWGDFSKAPTAAQRVTPQELKVTPNIRAGDVVQISNANGQVLAGHPVLAANITEIIEGPGLKFTVKGNLGAGDFRDKEFVEQRIINPDWTTTSLGRRDARALPGGIAASDKGGYSSGMTIDHTTGDFTATYIFADEEAHGLAINGGSRIMAWMDVDGDGNRLGLTIFEDGELGGPGLGGCPNGPDSVAAPQGSFAAQRAGDVVTFNWTKPAVVPDASPLKGYYMAAMEKPASTTQTEHVELGKRIMDASVLSTTVTVTSGKEYDYEMRSITDAGGFSPAFTKLRSGTTSGPTGGTPPDDLKANLDGNVVTLTSVGACGTPEACSLETYYTLSPEEGGNPVALGADTVAPNATLYGGPITLPPTAEPKYIEWIAFNKADLYTAGKANVTVAGATPIREAPVVEKAVAGQKALTVTWSTTDPNIVTFDVLVYDGATAAATLVKTVSAAKTARTAEVTALAEVDHYVVVRGVNVAGNCKVEGSCKESARKGPYKPLPLTDKLTILATGRYRAGKDFRVDGTATNTTASLHLCRGNGKAPVDKDFICNPITQTFQAIPGVAGANPTWQYRATGVTVTGGVNPLFVRSTLGGIAGPVTLGARRLRRAL